MAYHYQDDPDSEEQLLGMQHPEMSLHAGDNAIMHKQAFQSQYNRNYKAPGQDYVPLFRIVTMNDQRKKSYKVQSYMRLQVFSEEKRGLFCVRCEFFC